MQHLTVPSALAIVTLVDVDVVRLHLKTNVLKDGVHLKIDHVLVVVLGFSLTGLLSLLLLCAGCCYRLLGATSAIFTDCGASGLGRRCGGFALLKDIVLLHLLDKVIYEISITARVDHFAVLGHNYRVDYFFSALASPDLSHLAPGFHPGSVSVFCDIVAFARDLGRIEKDV